MKHFIIVSFDFDDCLGYLTVSCGRIYVEDFVMNNSSITPSLCPYWLPHSFPPSWTSFLIHSLTPSLTLLYSFTPSLRRSLTLLCSFTPSLPCSLTLLYSFTPSRPCSLTLLCYLTPSLPRSLTLLCSLTPSLPHSLTLLYSFTPSLPSSLTLLCSLTPSLPCSLTLLCSLTPSLPRSLTLLCSLTPCLLRSLTLTYTLLHIHILCGLLLSVTVCRLPVSSGSEHLQHRLHPLQAPGHGHRHGAIRGRQTRPSSCAG